MATIPVSQAPPMFIIGRCQMRVYTNMTEEVMTAWRERRFGGAGSKALLFEVFTMTRKGVLTGKKQEVPGIGRRIVVDLDLDQLKQVVERVRTRRQENNFIPGTPRLVLRMDEGLSISKLARRAQVRTDQILRAAAKLVRTGLLQVDETLRDGRGLIFVQSQLADQLVAVASNGRH